MEKNKLIIQSIMQAQLTPAQAAEHFGVSRRWVYELMRRERELGEEGLNPRSKRPRSSWHRFEATQPNEMWQSDF